MLARLDQAAVGICQRETVERPRDRVNVAALLLQQHHQHQKGQGFGKKLHKQFRAQGLEHDAEGCRQDHRPDGAAVGTGHGLVIAEEKHEAQNDIKGPHRVEQHHPRPPVIDELLVHVEGQAREGVCQDHQFRQKIRQGEEEIKAPAAPHAGAIDIHDVKGKADGERRMEHEIEGVQEVLPAHHPRRGIGHQPGPDHRGGGGKQVGHQQQKKYKVLVLELCDEPPAHHVLPPLHRERVDQAGQSEYKSRDFKADCLQVIPAFVWER